MASEKLSLLLEQPFDILGHLSSNCLFGYTWHHMPQIGGLTDTQEGHLQDDKNFRLNCRLAAMQNVSPHSRKPKPMGKGKFG